MKSHWGGYGHGWRSTRSLGELSKVAVSQLVVSLCSPFPPTYLPPSLPFLSSYNRAAFRRLFHRGDQQRWLWWHGRFAHGQRGSVRKL